MLVCTCHTTWCENQTDFVISCNSMDQDTYSEKVAAAITSTVQQYGEFRLCSEFRLYSEFRLHSEFRLYSEFRLHYIYKMILVAL